jgi:hypothetical protein
LGRACKVIFAKLRDNARDFPARANKNSVFMATIQQRGNAKRNKA